MSMLNVSPTKNRFHVVYASPVLSKSTSIKRLLFPFFPPPPLENLTLIVTDWSEPRLDFSLLRMSLALTYPFSGLDNPTCMKWLDQRR